MSDSSGPPAGAPAPKPRRRRLTAAESEAQRAEAWSAYLAGEHISFEEFIKKHEPLDSSSVN